MIRKPLVISLAGALCASAEVDVFEGQGSEPSSFYGTVTSTRAATTG